jgi:hypothetical protein
MFLYSLGLEFVINLSTLSCVVGQKTSRKILYNQIGTKQTTIQIAHQGLIKNQEGAEMSYSSSKKMNKQDRR